MLSNISKQKAVTAFSAGIFCIICASGIIYSQKRSLAKLEATKNIDIYRAESNAESARLSFLTKAYGFGFNNLIADYAYLNFINYFGDNDARNKIGHGLTSKYLETIIAKDPMHTEAQFIISPMVTLKQGDPEETVALLDRSLAKLEPIINSEDRDKLYKPNFLWVYKGIDELLFIGDAQAAEKSYRKAAEWSQILGDDTRAKSTSQMADYLAKDPDNRTVQVGAWFNVWNSAPDIETREMAQQNIERLGGRLEIKNGRATAYPPQDKEG